MNLAFLRRDCRGASRRRSAGVLILLISTAFIGCFDPDEDAEGDPWSPSESTTSTPPEAEQPESAEPVTLYYGIDRSRLDGHARTQGAKVQVVDACSFASGESIVIADVTESTEWVSGCQNGDPADVVNHTRIPLTVAHTIAGEPVPDQFDLVYRSHIVDPPPKFGESILVAVVEDQGDYFLSSTVFVNEEPTFIESRVPAPNRAVDLPSTLDELKSQLSETMAAPASVCSAQRLEQYPAPSELISFNRTHREDPCNGEVHYDDGMP